MGLLQQKLCKNCKKKGELVENTSEGYIYCNNCGLINGEVLDHSGGKEGLLSGNRADVADATDELLQDEMTVDIDRNMERDFRLQKQVLYGHTAKIGLSGSVADGALRIYAKFVNHKKKRGERLRLKEEAIAACILEAASNVGITISLQEILHSMRFPEGSHRRTITHISRIRNLLFDLQGKDASIARQEGSFDLRTQYREIFDRAKAKLLFPGLWTSQVGASLAVLLENELDEVPGQGVLCAYLLYLFLTTKCFAKQCGIKESFVVPLDSRGEPVVRDRIAKHFCVSWHEIEELKSIIDVQMMQKILKLATYESEKAEKDWENENPDLQSPVTV
ncbi:hypothetical protein XU18_3063 [Perkinsela sp. CCAP 1560/4]|nr:hypothetical protein XU18_3187 [Perkinsela sp. CCAP 1560/4]KNH06006.1 hypothetical protein XU18_3063 [Perkinsela sp. CCAP 1560/4]|eukprot:KNH05910.1 hypothetical protein XU18_3187 [Perkinsela sp. CCAP 1560/4]